MSSFLRSTVRISSQISRRNFTSTSRRMAPKQEWLIILPDYEGALARRMEVRPKHLEAAKPNVEAGIIALGGAMLDEPLKEGEPMKINGSVFVLCADTKEEAMELVEKDIYYTSDVWNPDKIQITPFKSAIRKEL